MTKRPDRLTISLGVDQPQRREALINLACDLDFIGRQGPSISMLVNWLADTYMLDSEATVKFLNAAGHVAAGGDIEDYLIPGEL